MLSIFEELLVDGHLPSHDRKPSGHRFEQNQPEPFLPRGENERLRSVQKTDFLLVIYEPVERDGILDPEFYSEIP